ncbi:prepilin peptidase [Candidatus Fermentibacterales bacterium]|nr:prepilin peptidase [Candidatus Fermentibacterales bacterium]
MLPETARQLLLLLFSGLFGLAVGSFLNVVSLRLPRGESIVRPASHCPGCGRPIAWFDNLPVLSYLLLRGRCRHCRMRISPQYPAVELLTGLLFLAAAAVRGQDILLVRDMVFVSLMILTAVVDLRFWIVLDEVSLGGAAAGLAFSLLPGGVGILRSLLTSASALALFLLIRLVASLVLARRPGYTKTPEGLDHDTDGEGFQGGMGWGDVKLAACMGAFLGPERTAVALFAAFLTGALTGVALIVLAGRDKRVPVPFGPFLALGSVFSLFLGDAVWRAYTGIGAW